MDYLFVARPDVLHLPAPEDQLDLYGPKELDLLARVLCRVTDLLCLPKGTVLTYDGLNLDVTWLGFPLVTLSARLNARDEAVITGAFPRRHDQVRVMDDALLAEDGVLTGRAQQLLLARDNTARFTLGRLNVRTAALTEDPDLIPKVRSVTERLLRVTQTLSAQRRAQPSAA